MTSLTRLLDLVEFQVTHFEIAGEELNLKCEPRFDVAQCPRCDQISECVHQHKERLIRDLSISGIRVTLYIEARRFSCDCCQKPFTESQETYNLSPN